MRILIEYDLTRNDAGKLVISQSMIKAFKQCPREFYYKQILRLQPKVHSVPLTRGKWMHALLEAYYKELADSGDHTAGESKASLEHKRWTKSFSTLFDEEKEKLGDLPRECWLLWQSYMWHWAEDRSWTIHEVERTLEAELPNGMTFKGRVDMIVEDEYGLWIVDHKTHKRMPDWTYRLLDEQSPLYIWAARENGIPVQGFIWNYLLTAAPSIPKVLVNGSAFYKRLGDTTYPVFARAVKRAQLEHPETFLKDASKRREVASLLRVLKAQKGRDSDFFRRDRLEKSDELLERVVATTMRTGEAIEAYDWSQPDLVERNVNACKGFMCSYKDLSQVDLINGGVDTITVRQRYKVESPWNYYEEEKFND